MFGSPSPPAPTPAPAPPTVEDAEVKADQDAQDLRRRRGRASTVLSTPSSTDNPTVQTQQLLG